MKPEYNKKEFETVQVTVRLPNTLNDFMQDAAGKMGISKNSLIVTKLWELAKQA